MGYKKYIFLIFATVLILFSVGFVSSASNSIWPFSSTTFKPVEQQIYDGLISYGPYSLSNPSVFWERGKNYVIGVDGFPSETSKVTIYFGENPDAAASNNPLPSDLAFLENFDNGNITIYGNLGPGPNYNSSNEGTSGSNYKTAAMSSANFTIINGGEYIIDQNDFYAPAGSRIVLTKGDTGWDSGQIKIYPPDNSNFTKFPSLTNPQDLISGTEIKGKNIVLPDGTKIIDGKVNYGLEGETVERGLVDYKNKLISVTKPSEQVLISNGLDKNPGGSNNLINWIRESNGNLHIQSAKGGTINMKFLPGDKTLNAGQNENLLMQVKNGDAIDISSASTQAPYQQDAYISHYSLGGSTLIKDGSLGTLLYTNKGVQLQKGNLNLPGITPTTASYPGSVPLFIKSDALGLQYMKLGINSNNQLKIISPVRDVILLNKNLAQNINRIDKELKNKYGMSDIVTTKVK